jgi:hypothetical protein
MKQDLLNEVKTRNGNTFGHIKRCDSLLNNILEGKVEGIGARRRKRYIWDNIKQWTGNSLTECTTAQETANVGKQLWRTFDAETALNLT